MRTARLIEITAVVVAVAFATGDHCRGNSPGGSLELDEEGADLNLPVWTEEDASRLEQAGSALLGGGLWPIELQPEAVPAIPEESGAGFAGRSADDPISRTRSIATNIDVPKVDTSPPVAVADAPPPPEEMAPPPGIVPAEFRDAYFGRQPATFLSDPQGLLSEQKTNDLARFLEYHEGESAFAIYTLVFGARQELPEGVTIAGLRNEWFGDERVVLLGYFLGEPKRAVIDFGEGALSSLGAETVSEVLESCIEDARVAENAFNQLERFCIELSIRLYWVEKENGMQRGVASLAEGARTPGVEAAVAKRAAATRSAVGGGFVLSAVLAGIALLSGLTWICWWRLRTATRTCVFPDYEVLPRLSAPHSGGGHAVLFFGRKGG